MPTKQILYFCHIFSLRGRGSSGLRAASTTRGWGQDFIRLCRELGPSFRGADRSTP
jgi:hypothetical protein